MTVRATCFVLTLIYPPDQLTAYDDLVGFRVDVADDFTGGEHQSACAGEGTCAAESFDKVGMAHVNHDQ